MASEQADKFQVHWRWSDSIDWHVVWCKDRARAMHVEPLAMFLREGTMAQDQVPRIVLPANTRDAIAEIGKEIETTVDKSPRHCGPPEERWGAGAVNGMFAVLFGEPMPSMLMPAFVALFVLEDYLGTGSMGREELRKLALYDKETRVADMMVMAVDGVRHAAVGRAAGTPLRPPVTYLAGNASSADPPKHAMPLMLAACFVLFRCTDETKRVGEYMCMYVESWDEFALTPGLLDDLSPAPAMLGGGSALATNKTPYRVSMVGADIAHMVALHSFGKTGTEEERAEFTRLVVPLMRSTRECAFRVPQVCQRVGFLMMESPPKPSRFTVLRSAATGRMSITPIVDETVVDEKPVIFAAGAINHRNEYFGDPRLNPALVAKYMYTGKFESFVWLSAVMRRCIGAVIAGGFATHAAHSLWRAAWGSCADGPERAHGNWTPGDIDIFLFGTVPQKMASYTRIMAELLRRYPDAQVYNTHSNGSVQSVHLSGPVPTTLGWPEESVHVQIVNTDYVCSEEVLLRFDQTYVQWAFDGVSLYGSLEAWAGLTGFNSYTGGQTMNSLVSKREETAVVRGMDAPRAALYIPSGHIQVLNYPTAGFSRFRWRREWEYAELVRQGDTGFADPSKPLFYDHTAAAHLTPPSDAEAIPLDDPRANHRIAWEVPEGQRIFHYGSLADTLAGMGHFFYASRSVTHLPVSYSYTSITHRLGKALVRGDISDPLHDMGDRGPVWTRNRSRPASIDLAIVREIDETADGAVRLWVDPGPFGLQEFLRDMLTGADSIINSSKLARLYARREDGAQELARLLDKLADCVSKMIVRATMRGLIPITLDHLTEWYKPGDVLSQRLNPQARVGTATVHDIWQQRKPDLALSKVLTMDQSVVSLVGQFIFYTDLEVPLGFYAQAVYHTEFPSAAYRDGLIALRRSVEPSVNPLNEVDAAAFATMPKTDGLRNAWDNRMSQGINSSMLSIADCKREEEGAPDAGVKRKREEDDVPDGGSPKRVREEEPVEGAPDGYVQLDIRNFALPLQDEEVVVAEDVWPVPTSFVDLDQEPVPEEDRKRKRDEYDEYDVLPDVKGKKRAVEPAVEFREVAPDEEPEEPEEETELERVRRRRWRNGAPDEGCSSDVWVTRDANEA